MSNIKEVLKEFLYDEIDFSEIQLSFSYIYDKLRSGKRLSQDDFDEI